MNPGAALQVAVQSQAIQDSGAGSSTRRAVDWEALSARAEAVLLLSLTSFVSHR